MDDAHEIAVNHTIQVFLLAHEFLINDVVSVPSLPINGYFRILLLVAP
jgi:hypothetical protein